MGPQQSSARRQGRLDPIPHRTRLRPLRQQGAGQGLQQGRRQTEPDRRRHRVGRHQRPRKQQRRLLQEPRQETDERPDRRPDPRLRRVGPEYRRQPGPPARGRRDPGLDYRQHHRRRDRRRRPPSRCALRRDKSASTAARSPRSSRPRTWSGSWRCSLSEKEACWQDQEAARTPLGIPLFRCDALMTVGVALASSNWASRGPRSPQVVSWEWCT